MHPLVVEAMVVYEEGVGVGGTGVVDNRDQRWGRRVKLLVVLTHIMQAMVAMAMAEEAMGGWRHGKRLSDAD